MPPAVIHTNPRGNRRDAGARDQLPNERAGTLPGSRAFEEIDPESLTASPGTSAFCLARRHTGIQIRVYFNNRSETQEARRWRRARVERKLSGARGLQDDGNSRPASEATKFFAMI
jgi:hypothetical protein